MHEPALRCLRTEAPHSVREQLLELHRLAVARDDIYARLSDAESDQLCRLDDDAGVDGWDQLPAGVRRYLELERACWSIYSELQAAEHAKIRAALKALDEWLSTCV